MPAGRKNKYESHVQPRLEEIKWWCRDGRTDKEIASLLGVAYRSFMRYKNQFSQLCQALKNNKEYADLKVEDSLNSRANGIFWDEITTQKLYLITKEDKDGIEKQVYTDSLKGVEKTNIVHETIDGKQEYDSISVETNRVTRFVPPSETAGIFWLTNRQPAKFKRNRDNITGTDNGSMDALFKALKDSADIIAAGNGGDNG